MSNDIYVVDLVEDGHEVYGLENIFTYLKEYVSPQVQKWGQEDFDNAISSLEVGDLRRAAESLLELEIELKAHS